MLLLLFVACNIYQSLKKCFPEYDGPEGESLPALRYIEQKYKQARLTGWYLSVVLHKTNMKRFNRSACKLSRRQASLSELDKSPTRREERDETREITRNHERM